MKIGKIFLYCFVQSMFGWFMFWLGDRVGRRDQINQDQTYLIDERTRRWREGYDSGEEFGKIEGRRELLSEGYHL